MRNCIIRFFYAIVQARPHYENETFEPSGGQVLEGSERMYGNLELLGR